jgi:uncharacterized membrane protein YeaQ/YmgE (transglycosylase-associated protein family)
MFLIGFLTIGVVVGIIAGLVRKSKGSDIAGFIVVGVLGSIMGGALFGAFRQSPQSHVGAQGAAFLGAVILVAFSETMKKI